METDDEFEAYFQKLRYKLTLLERVRNARITLARAKELKQGGAGEYLDFAMRRNDYKRWCEENGEDVGF